MGPLGRGPFVTPEFVCADDDLTTCELCTVKDVIAKSCGGAAVADDDGGDDADDNLLEDGDSCGDRCSTASEGLHHWDALRSFFANAELSTSEKASSFCLSSDGDKREQWKRAIQRQEAGSFSFDSQHDMSVSMKNILTPQTLFLAMISLCQETPCLRNFVRLGLLPPEGVLPTACRRIFQMLWANNGDIISRQYAGTAALKVCSIHGWTCLMCKGK
ncbi:hypothetical protein HPB48_017561 [Haemaphysalis longicornis]|uniref:Uncharacterized protein n=1 Tax=Haemaphysalis longicornis TaxID=44386 RepID=A0A9J6FLB1_HAELO|nr:hypothetical protein HPB48_017561 [Haemaphysalis longicornis]